MGTHVIRNEMKSGIAGRGNSPIQFGQSIGSTQCPMDHNVWPEVVRFGFSVVLELDPRVADKNEVTR